MYMISYSQPAPCCGVSFAFCWTRCILFRTLGRCVPERWARAYISFYDGADCPLSLILPPNSVTANVVQTCRKRFLVVLCLCRKADVYKTLEELVPLQVNVQAVASREVSESDVFP